MNTFKTSLAFAALLSLAPLTQAQVAETKSLTMEGARQVIAAAVAEANNKKTTGVIAVVDNGGNLMALERIDGTFAAGANISIGKARTALLFQKRSLRRISRPLELNTRFTTISSTATPSSLSRATQISET